MAVGFQLHQGIFFKEIICCYKNCCYKNKLAFFSIYISGLFGCKLILAKPILEPAQKYEYSETRTIQYFGKAMKVGIWFAANKREKIWPCQNFGTKPIACQIF